MTAKELLDAGQLSDAITRVNQDLKAHPTDARLRTFLFELLCFAGDYQRAERQLEILGQQNTSTEIGIQVFRHIIASEQARQRLLSDGLAPHFVLPPPPYTRFHLEALNRLRQNQHAEAKTLLEESVETRPTLTGVINGRPFASLRDSDDLLAPFLEVIVQDRYTWLPFDQMKRLQMSPPKRLRDLLWAQATLEMMGGAVGEVFVPVLYVGSHAHTDDAIRLGRMTDWGSLGEGLARGMGQRVLLIDNEEQAMLEIREIEFVEAAAH
jgi:type VI secretion system protein ImpE